MPTRGPDLLSRSALANPNPTPLMMAVPQSGPMTSTPAAAAASFSAISSARGTLSEKIITCRPAWMASSASPSTADPGSDSSTSDASGCAAAADRTVRGGATPEIPDDDGTLRADSDVSSAPSAASTAASSSPRRVINRSLGPVPSGMAKPSPAASSTLSGVAIATCAAVTPGVSAAAWDSRSNVTESW